MYYNIYIEDTFIRTADLDPEGAAAHTRFGYTLVIAAHDTRNVLPKPMSEWLIEEVH